MNTDLACQYVQQQQCMDTVLLPACPVWLCGSLMDFSKSFWTQWHRRKVKSGVCYAGNTCFFRKKKLLHLLFDGQGYPFKYPELSASKLFSCVCMRCRQLSVCDLRVIIDMILSLFYIWATEQTDTSAF